MIERDWDFVADLFSILGSAESCDSIASLVGAMPTGVTLVPAPPKPAKPKVSKALNQQQYCSRYGSNELQNILDAECVEPLKAVAKRYRTKPINIQHIWLNREFYSDLITRQRTIETYGKELCETVWEDLELCSSLLSMCACYGISLEDIDAIEKAGWITCQPVWECLPEEVEQTDDSINSRNGFQRRVVALLEPYSIRSMDRLWDIRLGFDDEFADLAQIPGIDSEHIRNIVGSLDDARRQKHTTLQYNAPVSIPRNPRGPKLIREPNAKELATMRQCGLTSETELKFGDLLACG